MQVKAQFSVIEVTVTEDGTDTVVPLATARDVDAGWVPVGPYIRASLTASVDSSGSDITVLGKRTENAPSETILTKTTYASGTRNVLNREFMEGWAYIQVKSDGTDTEETSFYLLLK